MKQLTQAQASELEKMAATMGFTPAAYEIIEPQKAYDVNDLFGNNEDEFDGKVQAGIAWREADIAKRDAEIAEDAKMIADGYEQQTTTEWEPEWDGEGGEYVTRTEWVKSS